MLNQATKWIICATFVTLLPLGTSWGAPSEEEKKDEKKPAVEKMETKKDDKNAGLPLLDEAMAKKVSAKSLEALEKVINLCESAKAKGLDQENTRFANDLLASTYQLQGKELGVLARKAILANHPMANSLRKKALDSLGKSVKLAPNQPATLLEMGHLHLLPGGNKNLAMAAAKEALKLAGKDKNIKIQALLLRLTITEDNKLQAKLLADVEKIAPNDSRVIRFRALLHLKSKRYKDVIKDADLLLKEEPRNLPALQLKLQAYEELEDDEKALDMIDEMLKIAPQHPLLFAQKAQKLAVLGRLDESVEQLNLALAILPNQPGLLLLRGSIRNAQGKIDEALADAKKVMGVEPNNAHAKRLYAMLRIQQGEEGMKDAIKTVKQLVEDDDNDLESLRQLAMFYLGTSQSTEAIKCLDKLIKKEPKDPDHVQSRGDAYLNLGQHAKAVANYKDAYAIYEKETGKVEDSGLLNNYAWVLCTSPDAKVRDAKKSLQYAKKAAELTKHKKPHILSTLGAAYAENGNFVEAAKWCQKGLDLLKKEEPDNTEHFESLTKELENYKKKKPFRENLDEKDGPKPFVRPKGEEKDEIPLDQAI